MSEEHKHSDVDDVDVDEDLKEAVHDGPIGGEEGRGDTGEQGTDASGSSTSIGKDEPV